MANELDPIEYENFIATVDGILDAIAKGEKPSLSDTNITVEDVTVRATATEKGEDEVVNTIPSSPTIVIGKISDPTKVVCICNDSTEELFGNAAEAARAKGLNPTTVRERCKKYFTDSNGYIWKFVTHSNS